MIHLEDKLRRERELSGNYDLELTQMSFCRGHEQEAKPLEKKISCHCMKNTDLIHHSEHEHNQTHSDNDPDQNWIIPITISSNQTDCPTTKFLMTKKQDIFHLNTPISPSIDDSSDQTEPSNKKRRYSSHWFKVNVCSGGPYRVFYSPDILEDLVEAMNQQELNTFDRFNIENDMYALAMGGFTSLVDYLRLLLNAYVNETDDELVWKDIESNLIRIGTLLEYDKQLFEFYRKFILYFHRNLYRIVGFTSKNNHQQQQEPIARGRLRCFLLVVLGTIGYDSTIISNAREQLLVYLNDPTVTVLWPICAIVAHHASETDLNNLFLLWEQRTHRDDRLRCAYGLSYVQNGSQIERVLDFFAILNPNQNPSIRLNERIECYKGFCLSKQGRYYYQRFIENHWFTLRTNYTDEYLEALIRETFGYFSSKDEAIRIEEFFLSYETFHQKHRNYPKETPPTPCTRIAVHLCLDDQELSSINRSTQPSPILPHRSIIPEKVKEIASIIAHTTRTRAALLEREHDHLLTFFQTNPFPLSTTQTSSSSSQILSLNTINNLSTVVSPCSTTTTTGNKRKRRISSLNTSSSSPPVRNLLASDTSA